VTALPRSIWVVPSGSVAIEATFVEGRSTMNKRIIGQAAVAGMLLVSTNVLAATAAGADPSGAKNSLTFPVTCSTGETVQDISVVVNSANGHGSGTENNPKGQANFTPGHVVGTNQVFHPTRFDLDFTFTVPGVGVVGSFTDTVTMRNAKTPTRCTIDATVQADTEGDLLTLSGTVWGFFT